MIYQLLQTLIPWTGFLWWPLSYTLLYRGYMYTAVTTFVSGMAMCQFEVPYNLRRVYNQLINRDIHIDIKGDVGTSDTPDITLIVPHGMLCVESAAVMSNLIQQSGRMYTCFFDNKLYKLSPPASFMTKIAGATITLPLRHTEIEHTLRTQPGRSVCVFPGGFVEAVGGADIRYTATYSYWIRQARRHNRVLRILHVYNGTMSISQSQLALSHRLRLAARGIPIPLPIAIRRIDRLVARTWCYTPSEVQLLTREHIEKDLLRYAQVDREVNTVFGTPRQGFPLKYNIYSSL